MSKLVRLVFRQSFERKAGDSVVIPICSRFWKDKRKEHIVTTIIAVEGTGRTKARRKIMVCFGSKARQGPKFEMATFCEIRRKNGVLLEERK